jgi:hypothetical protein
MDVYRILGWLVPSLCILGSARVIYNCNQEFRAATADQLRVHTDLQLAQATKAGVDRQPAGSQFAAATMNPMEETLFLNDLRNRARTTGAIIAKWTSKATIYTDTPTLAYDATTARLLNGITKVDCDLTLTGDYHSVRTLIQGLLGSHRLFTIDNAAWTRADSGTQLTLSLGRYVSPPAKNATTPSTASPVAMNHP